MTMHPAKNIRARLTLWYVAILAGILSVYIAVVFAFQFALLKRQIIHDEIQDVETVEGLLYFDANGVLHLNENYHSQPRSRLLADRLMEVRSLSGVVLYRTATLNGMALGGPSFAGEGSRSYDDRVITLADGTRALTISHLHPVAGREVLIRLAYSLAPLSERMFQFLTLLLVAMPIALIGAAFAGYGIARRALFPLDRMAARAEQITAHNLEDRLVIENEHDELGHIGRVFNHLLERLEQAFLQLQHFTADAAHELRTPLAAIRAMGEIALQDAKEDANCRETISSMLEETERLGQTIDGLMMLSKTETLRVGEASTLFLLPDLVNEILALLDVVMEEQHITVRQAHEDTLRRPVSADRSLVRVALFNVLHNAVKFSGAHSNLEISYSSIAFQPHGAERVCIHDAGPGIAAGEHQRVFERFFTGHAHGATGGTGTGLGLSIAKLAIERSGGRIFFDESVMAGARCCIDLPLAPQECADRPVE